MDKAQEAVARTVRGIVLLLRSTASKFKDVSGDTAIEQAAEMIEKASKKMGK